MKQCVSGLFFSVLALFAQTDRGAITGWVTDSTSAPIPGVQVAATHQSTVVRYASTTNESGNFSNPQLPFGRYDFEAEATGFRRHVRKDIEINVGQTVTLNLKLEIGKVEQQIEVVGNAPVVESATSDVGTVVSARNVIDLPLAVSGNMRNPEAFIFLTPGVTGDTVNTQINDFTLTR